MKTGENIATVALLVVLSLPAFGKVCVANKKFKVREVCGYIRDKDGAVIPGASVSLKRVGAIQNVKEVSSDDEGKFQFDEVTDGDYELRVKYPIFDDAWQPILVAGSHKKVSCPKPMSVVMRFTDDCSSVEKSKRSNAQGR